MIRVERLADWRAIRRELAGSIGFVPTMGALHEGHAELINTSVRDNATTVLSIYINPTQFNNAADFEHYPATLDDDLALAESLGVDCVLLPTYDEIYPDGFRYQVEETDQSLGLCGADRPGHFTGVLTVVMKLFNLVQPTRAYFGEKDYQQYELVRDMCQAFFLPVEVVPCPTVREADGLAMSSRNKNLSTEGRCLAKAFNTLLRAPMDDDDVARKLEDTGFKVDYVRTVRGRRYGAVVVSGGAVDVRLIDNFPDPLAEGVNT